MKIKAFLALLLVCCIILPALAQTKPAAPPQQQQPGDDDDVVRISTNLVQVDAVVRKNGKPVTNLTADDFEIYEDGRKQTITSFTYISNIPNTVAAAPAPTTDKQTNIPPAGPIPAGPIKVNDPHRTIAFVVDDLGISAESMGTVRKNLKKFVAEELQPNDLVAIIRTGGELGVLQQFTNDKRVLNRALERLRWNPCSRTGMHTFLPAGMEDIQDGFRCGFSYGQTGRALRFIIDGLARLPGRKSLVLMSDDLPRESQEVDLGEQTDASGETVPRFTNTTNLSGMLYKIAEKAIRASVVIYSVDTQGLMYTGPTAADSFRGNYRQVTQQTRQIMSARSALLQARRGGGELLARQTGGFQIRNSNSFRFDDILEDQSGYYLLGYRPTDETFNRRFHHINAKVKRSGMTLRTRFGFFGVSEEEAKKSQLTVGDLTNLALASPFAAQDINLGFTPFFANDKSGASVVRSFVYLEARDLTFTPIDGRYQASLELQGVIFGDNGSVIQQLTRGADVSLLESDYQQALRNGMQLIFDIPVKRAGGFQVRIAARDKASSRIGSAGEFVNVPNLNNKNLAVSGIVLGTGIDIARQDLTNPGARRFTPRSDVHYGYMIYNATDESGAARNLEMQTKLFRDGKIVFSGPKQPLGAVSKTDPSRIFVYGKMQLTPEVEPGSYYLQVVLTETSTKKKVPLVVQLTDFEVEK